MKPTICTLTISVVSMVNLAGCSTPPPPPQVAHEMPYLIEYQGNIDPVHIRDHSAAHYDENRGGAALRNEQFRHVLYNRHYEAEDGFQAMLSARKEVESEKAIQKAIDEAMEVARKEPVSKSKDRSIYSKKPRVSRDRSIYANQRTKSENGEKTAGD